ncbi:MAG: sel1 repeat family protein [Paludibacteraceae bacterium]|nr:sel1 repeat family protein [Paludibacteraceae bacterium]
MEDLYKLALQGNVDAQYKLGSRYYMGEGVDIDYRESAKWYKMAAKQGHAEAQYFLAWQYSAGFGVPKNVKKAFELYLVAARQNHAAAQYALCGCYFKGDGVEVNIREALKWAEKAQENGLAAAAGVVTYYKSLLKVDEKESENEPELKIEDLVANEPWVNLERRKYDLFVNKKNPVRFIVDEKGKLMEFIGWSGLGKDYSEKYDYYSYDFRDGIYEFYRYSDTKIEDLEYISWFEPTYASYNFLIPLNIKDLVYQYIRKYETLTIDAASSFSEVVHANLNPEKRTYLTTKSNPVIRVASRLLLYRRKENLLIGYMPALLEYGFKNDRGYYSKTFDQEDMSYSAYYVDRVCAVYHGYTACVEGVDRRSKSFFLTFTDADGKAAGIKPKEDDNLMKMIWKQCERLVGIESEADHNAKRNHKYEAYVPMDQVTDVYEIRKPFAKYPFHTPEKVYHKKDNEWLPWHKFGTLLYPDEWI